MNLKHPLLALTANKVLVQQRARNAIYLLLGWVCVLEISDLKNALAPAGLFWLVVGGLIYTLGIVFYALDEWQKLRHAHGIWHLFVLLGSMCHFVAVIAYVR